jgi:hypothetical protein
MSILDGLALVFVTLKLMGAIDWSWWLVLLPWYGPLIVHLLLIIKAEWDNR